MLNVMGTRRIIGAILDLDYWSPRVVLPILLDLRNHEGGEVELADCEKSHKLAMFDS